MNGIPQAKAYRLINSHELNQLNQYFAARLQIWNEQYALFALGCHLSVQPKPELTGAKPLIARNDGDMLALIDSEDWSTLQYCLFGDNAGCFTAISRKMFINLLEYLTEAVEIDLQSQAIDYQDWFYPGAPTLMLTLTSAVQSLNLHFHPLWVLNRLPKFKADKTPPDLNSALNEQKLQLAVELLPLKLPMQSIMRLQVGDVIKTDHPLVKPLLLKGQHQPVCQVRAGQIQSQKSIQITREL
ncbi:FliM/FliN family flagellar motor C-terminal domain-containing protein [Legionella dresdenensis]|uniref:FliM/FliN family flagellar motor C-terminal domain-containing protein n=1 Tax=Legionella dresdenensis TaxID=450200 RepID=A0ABV8CHC0_9GAMM